MIARNELAAADYYMTINAYVASVRRANYVIENIPNSSENYRALKILESAYQVLGYSDLHEDIVKIIELNYDESEFEQADDNSGWSWNFLRNIRPSPSD